MAEEERIPEKCKFYSGDIEAGYISCYRHGSSQKIGKYTCEFCPDYKPVK